MDKVDRLFKLAQVRQMDLALLLEKLGHEPTARKKNDTDWWYLSPLRHERTASFHIDRVNNGWYDFGLAVGGNPVDFLLRYYDCSVAEMLVRLNDNFGEQRVPAFEPGLRSEGPSDKDRLVIQFVKSLYAYPLKNYLHERSIPVAVADNYCKEVVYEIGGGRYYGLGFANDMGGWEIRNKNYKQSASPKDITTFRFGSDRVQVFEGFMDFLSYQTLHPYEEPGNTDFVVLNGAGMFDRALPFLQRHQQVGLWLDRDVTGQAFTKYALSLGSNFVDRSVYYEKFKDLNEWLMHKGEVPKQVRQLARGKYLSVK
ncbi:toprim domain-containing protein [Mucilaginibacter sp. CAU 1740]|uniref:toprim domain-containing protein n=1 Tax=Mucilaginibacter sp. CAU 1740 TaxID=3140365 RepID=UPI00325B02B2